MTPFEKTVIWNRFRLEVLPYLHLLPLLAQVRIIQSFLRNAPQFLHEPEMLKWVADNYVEVNELQRSEP